MVFFLIGGLQRQKRLRLLVQCIKRDNPDIILLQEMPIALLFFNMILFCGDFLKLRKELQELGYTYHTDPLQSFNEKSEEYGNFLEWIFGRLYNHGLVIFSKLPITASHTRVFSPKYRRYFRWRGFLCAQVQINGTSNLHIINTHLETTNCQAKLGQINAIKQYVLTRIKAKDIDLGRDHLLIAGDFNICSNYTWDSHLHVSERMYTILCENMKEIGLGDDLFANAKKTFWYNNSDESLDHMFVSGKLFSKIKHKEVVDYKDNVRHVSDHLGLWAEFEI
ncbi:hypothetical protein RFI_22505 [Reticulomyxa filosa]|uniref:Endonuclease/exonuclease/phosphatase domain-containing protein n=1 Tax=Reticulomyxa filosa TaxID=46433 RepID=X6MP79_RETFI|nr:hypothetical protein RFI_22505 [Reticulomyxa filosa]|eukprot:ETO14860.1 hypothetical protein RFI_22505 [Reticulomyxa filosa]